MLEFRLRVVPSDFKQALVDYANAVATVNLYAYSITQQDLPDLKRPPEDYADFTVAFAPAKKHCLEWTGGIFPSILSFPRIIVEQTNDLFNLESTMGKDYLKILQSDPGNVAAKNGLNSILTSMQNIIQQQIDTSNNIIHSLNNFSENINKDAGSLSDIAKRSLDDMQSDSDKIIELNKTIQDLNDQLSTFQTLLTVSQIGTAVCIFVGLIGLVVCVVPGGQKAGIGILILAAMGEIASIATWIISQEQIDSINKSIAAIRASVADLNQDVIVLQSVSQAFQNLVTANMAAQNALLTINKMWRDLYNDLQKVKTDLTNTENEVTSEDYFNAESKLKDADNDWKQVVEFAKALADIDYKWQDNKGAWHSYLAEHPQSDQATITEMPSNAA